MAIETVKRRKGIMHRAYWLNPFLGKREVGPWTPDLAEAQSLDSLRKHQLRHDPEFFRPDLEVMQEEKPPESPVGMTVAVILAKYHQGADLTEKGRKETFYHGRQLAMHIGTHDIKALTRRDLKAMEQAMRESGNKQNTIQRRISVLRSAFAWAVDQGIIEENPIEGYKTRRGADEVLVPPSLEEIQAVYHHAPDHLKRIILLGYNMGCRIGPSELFILNWQDLEVRQDGTARFKVTASKKNRRVQWRWVPVGQSILPRVLAWRDEDKAQGISRVIHIKGQPIQHHFRTSWRNTLRAAGISRRIRPYDLRHAFATMALEAGADIGATAKIMGHSDTTMILRRYQHVSTDLERKAIELLPSIKLDIDKK